MDNDAETKNKNGFYITFIWVAYFLSLIIFNQKTGLYPKNYVHSNRILIEIVLLSSIYTTAIAKILNDLKFMMCCFGGLIALFIFFDGSKLDITIHNIYVSLFLYSFVIYCHAVEQLGIMGDDY